MKTYDDQGRIIRNTHKSGSFIEYYYKDGKQRVLRTVDAPKHKRAIYMMRSFLEYMVKPEVVDPIYSMSGIEALRAAVEEMSIELDKIENSLK